MKSLSQYATIFLSVAGCCLLFTMSVHGASPAASLKVKRKAKVSAIARLPESPAESFNVSSPSETSEEVSKLQMCDRRREKELEKRIYLCLASEILAARKSLAKADHCLATTLANFVEFFGIEEQAEPVVEKSTPSWENDQAKSDCSSDIENDSDHDCFTWKLGTRSESASAHSDQASTPDATPVRRAWRADGTDVYVHNELNDIPEARSEASSCTVTPKRSLSGATKSITPKNSPERMHEFPDLSKLQKELLPAATGQRKRSSPSLSMLISPAAAAAAAAAEHSELYNRYTFGL